MGFQKRSTETGPGTNTAGYVIDYPDATTRRLASRDESGFITRYPYMLSNASVAAQTGFAADTYLAGSSIVIPSAGDWSVAETYYCVFDMTKTNVGVAAFTITVRMGTLGTTSDAAILALAFGIGSTAVDSGEFEVKVTFRTVGSGTSAVIAGSASCKHHLAATGLITSPGVSGFGQVLGTSSGFNSTTQTVIGLSVNGGASFAGTNTLVQSQLVK